MIRRLRDETRCRIEIPADEAESDIITLVGRKENVEKAKKRILAIQAEQVWVMRRSFIIFFVTAFVASMCNENVYTKCLAVWRFAASVISLPMFDQKVGEVCSQ